jgi:peptidylprolyl isomerase domain and WD repeat-containing protein 1
MTLRSVLMGRTGFVITTSVDGHVKLWKKQEVGIEFVKQFRASLKGIVAVSASEDGKLFATVSESGEGRVFDVVNFGMSSLCLLQPLKTPSRPRNKLIKTDMINIFKFDFRPNAVAWVHAPGAGQTLLAVSETQGPTIRIYDGRGEGKPLHELTKIHRAPVHVMAVSA